MLGRFGDLISAAGFELAFRDRIAAANILCNLLRGKLKTRKNRESILILGIPRGGVVVANIVARRLGADFDVIIPRKLRAPDNKENSIGAIMPDGSTYLDESKLRWLKVSEDYIEKEKQDQLREIERRIALYRPDNRGYTIRQRTVVLIDDGIATGATLMAAARWVRKQQPEWLIVAAPVAHKEATDLLKREADQVETIIMPSNFLTVNQFYRNFDPIRDEEVIDIIKKSRM